MPKNKDLPLSLMHKISGSGVLYFTFQISHAGYNFAR